MQTKSSASGFPDGEPCPRVAMLCSSPCSSSPASTPRSSGGQSLTGRVFLLFFLYWFRRRRPGRRPDPRSQRSQTAVVLAALWPRVHLWPARDPTQVRFPQYDIIVAGAGMGSCSPGQHRCRQPASPSRTGRPPVSRRRSGTMLEASAWPSSHDPGVAVRSRVTNSLVKMGLSHARGRRGIEASPSPRGHCGVANIPAYSARFRVLDPHGLLRHAASWPWRRRAFLVSSGVQKNPRSVGRHGGFGCLTVGAGNGRRPMRSAGS